MIDPREAYQNADWEEYEAYLDGTLQALEQEQANIILTETANELQETA